MVARARPPTVGVLVERLEELPDTTRGAAAICAGETSGDGLTGTDDVEVEDDVVEEGVDVDVDVEEDGWTTIAGGLGVTPVNVVEPAEAPPGPLSTTVTVPLIPAGAVVEIVESESTVNGVDIDPNETVLTVENPVPVIVTDVPLVFDPLPGEITEITGAAT
jgi:hypothetical protein